MIQGKDGALYGVAQDGGIPGCNGAYGCGTLFRLSTTGVFSLLHQFCGSAGCPGIVEGGRPMNHLVQTADGTLYGTTSQGGYASGGTLFSANTSGVTSTLHFFQYHTNDGADPVAALLVGHDGSTMYGTTVYGGANDGGIVFSYSAGTLTILPTFNVTSAGPDGALIFGANGLLYGTTSGVTSGGGGGGSTIYSLDTTGGSFAVDLTFRSGAPDTGLLLGSDGTMYGTLVNGTPYGNLYAYDPSTKLMQSLLDFTATTGFEPHSVLIEGKDKYLYGSNSEGGSRNSLGDDGTLYRIGPALP